MFEVACKYHGRPQRTGIPGLGIAAMLVGAVMLPMAQGQRQRSIVFECHAEWDRDALDLLIL